MHANETAFHHGAGGEPLLHDARPHRKGGGKKSIEATKYVNRRLPGTTHDDEFIRDDAHFKPPSVNAMSGACSGSRLFINPRAQVGCYLLIHGAPVGTGESGSPPGFVANSLNFLSLL
jgi:hypothetical protein